VGKVKKELTGQHLLSTNQEGERAPWPASIRELVQKKGQREGRGLKFLNPAKKKRQPMHGRKRSKRKGKGDRERCPTKTLGSAGLIQSSAMEI